MNISWDDARIFLAVAEQQSFSAAARRLGLGQPTISRRIAELEAQTGCPLFHRGRRGAELTEDGARLLPAAEQMARWAGELGRLARGGESAPTGVVRIAAPPAVSVDFLAPIAARAREHLPGLRIEVLAGVEHVDLARGSADLAIRTHPPREPELEILASLVVPIGVYAAPAYAERLRARRGTSGPASLADLDWITWASPRLHVPPRPMLERAIPDFEPVFASDDYLVQRSALLAGLGAMVLERPRDAAGVVSATLAELETLVELDVGVRLPPAALHVVAARSMRAVPRIRAIVDLLREVVDLEDPGSARVPR